MGQYPPKSPFLDMHPHSKPTPYAYSVIFNCTRRMYCAIVYSVAGWSFDRTELSDLRVAKKQKEGGQQGTGNISHAYSMSVEAPQESGCGCRVLVSHSWGHMIDIPEFKGYVPPRGKHIRQLKG